MGRRYKVPFWSEVAHFIAAHLLPGRVLAWVWLCAYEDLEDHYITVYDRESLDGEGLSIYDAVSAIRIEGLRRKLFTKHLKATLQ